VEGNDIDLILRTVWRE